VAAFGRKAYVLMNVNSSFSYVQLEVVASLRFYIFFCSLQVS